MNDDIENENNEQDSQQYDVGNFEGNDTEQAILQRVLGESNAKQKDFAPKEEGTEDVDANKQTNAVDSKVSGSDKQTTAEPKQEKSGNVNNRGQLIDPETNEVIPHGAARRFYNEREEARASLKEITEKFNMATNNLNVVGAEYLRVTKELQHAQEQMEILKQAAITDPSLDLDAEEVVFAKKIGAQFKKDPVKTVENLIATLRQQGYNIEGLGTNADMRAVVGLIDQRLAPITAEHQQRLQQQADIQAAEQQITRLYAKHPEARLQTPLLTEMLQRDPNLSLEEAFYTLWQAANKHGLDISKPLSDQLNARQNQQRVASPKQQLGVPNTRSISSNPVRQAEKPANPFEDNSDIVRRVMIEAGFNFNG